MDSDASEYWDCELKEAVNMGKWNFDVLFEGSIDQQRENVANFLKGVTQRTREVAGKYADAVLNGDNAVHFGDRIAEYTEAVTQLTADSRLKNLSDEVNKQEAEKMVDSLTSSLREAIRRSR